ncbi:NUDIX domain-containing protein [candidate division KSB1 bacterium]|nr:NUDIX domain-containing protein [candidate division KSB1 bacterium]
MSRIEKFKFCPFCGGQITHLNEKFVRLKCDRCQMVHYLNPKVGVGLLIEVDNSIVLVRRKEEPFKGWWSLPAGYVEYEESCEVAALRESVEETGMNVNLGVLLGVYSYTDDPRSNMVLVVYRASTKDGSLAAGDDADEVQLFPINQLPQQIAFEGVRQAIKEYVSSLSR